jgi:hypothetical protein
MKFDESMCSGSRAVTADRRTDMAKPFDASDECANVLQVRLAAGFPCIFMSVKLKKKKISRYQIFFFVCGGESWRALYIKTRVALSSQA